MKKLYNIDHVINPEQATANEIMRYLMESYSFYFDEYAKGKVSVVNLNIRNLPDFVNHAIKDLEIMNEIVIVAISRNGDIIIPDGDIILKENDIFIYHGPKE